MTAGAALDQLPLPLLRRGKVREVYEVDATRLLLVASDRVSAFDVVMAERVPHKGAVLTQLTAWWLRQLGNLVAHHMLAADADAIIAQVPSLAPHRAAISGRAMLCRRTEVFPIECVVRGYLSGSAWKEYREHGTLAGEALPSGLRESDRFDPPRFSPATKADSGHDENITFGQVKSRLGADVAHELERLSRLVYARGRDLAAARGIIIADTKFEFGRDPDGAIRLIDEVLTPDSSRFWAADRYAPGGPQPSFDKQPLRDYLDAERRARRWNGEAPPPKLPDAVIDATSARYLDAFQRLTGAPLAVASDSSPL
jgi:phosphoribosylaminoimidazole-succinocarboxamide synthase